MDKPKKKISASAQGRKNNKMTRDWYRAQGYACEYTEVLRTIFAGPGKMFYQKNDLFSSDGVAMNGKEMIFWNAKGATQREEGTLGNALRKFNEFPFPDFIIREVVVWEPKQKTPYRLRVQNGEIVSIDESGVVQEYEYRNDRLLKKIK
jgi:hypothetical protein